MTTKALKEAVDNVMRISRDDEIRLVLEHLGKAAESLAAHNKYEAHNELRILCAELRQGKHREGKA